MGRWMVAAGAVLAVLGVTLFAAGWNGAHLGAEDPRYGTYPVGPYALGIVGASLALVGVLSAVAGLVVVALRGPASRPAP